MVQSAVYTELGVKLRQPDANLEPASMYDFYQQNKKLISF